LNSFVRDFCESQPVLLIASNKGSTCIDNIKNH
jgi:hypothetical protein